MLPNSDSIGWHSHAQCGEDLIVRYLFHTLHKEKPSYLDIGAYDPYLFSNTAFFYIRGSQGICVEPDPDLYHRLKTARPRDTVLNVGIGPESGEATIYLMEPSTLNTFSRKQAETLEREKTARRRDERPVPVMTVEALLAQYAGGIFPDFLSLDTEALDLQILQSISFERSVPTVICVETRSYSLTGQGTKETEIGQFLQSVGYLLYADTHLNSIFVSHSAWHS
jgi:FkbM family methyltransferase